MYEFMYKRPRRSKQMVKKYPHGRMKGILTMIKEYVKELKLLTQMISERASNDVVRDQAKKVFDMGERIISELEEEGIYEEENDRE